MGTPADIDARRYYRVAYQRLEDGWLMLDKLNRPKGAVYLTGYAVECILKALILVITPSNARTGILKSFRGALAHDLLWLRAQLLHRHIVFPLAVARELAYVASWSVDLRYEPGPGDREDAQRFIASARAVLRWADGRM
jgi:HEPN domain-containing protein